VSDTARTEPESARRILETRAQLLAEPAQDRDEDNAVSVLVLSVGEERYSVDVRRIREILSVPVITPVPGTAPSWAGLVSIRGTMYPVLHLRTHLGVLSRAGGGEQKLVLVTAAAITAGLLVDDVADVRWITADEVRPSPAGARGGPRAYVREVTTDLVALLDLDALLSDPALVVDDEGT
jgi:purine-binding chemotaxis protein CheW